MFKKLFNFLRHLSWCNFYFHHQTNHIKSHFQFSVYSE